MADNIMGSLADQSTYDPATGMPYPGNAPDYGDLSQRMTNAQQRLAAGIYEAGAMPGRAFGTVPGGPPTPEEEANWGAGTAFGMLGASRIPGGAPAGAVGAGGAKLVQPEGIFAYHSSPYTFDKFDLSKIGTGEGAQMYGHGIYAAENPAVSGQGGQYWQQFMHRFKGPEEQAAQYLSMSDFDRAQAIKTVGDQLERNRQFRLSNPHEFDPERQARLEESFKLLQSGNPVGPRTYEVNINARPEQMLNWDAPLIQQSPHVKDMALQMGVTPDFYTLPGGRLANRLGGPTGADLYRSMATHLPDNPKYQNVYREPEGTSPQAASQVLNEAGIPGIRYLDQGSRFAQPVLKTTPAGDVISSHYPTPTSNYVIFDPNKLDIRKMYAVPGAVGAGGIMGGIAAQDNYQPQ